MCSWFWPHELCPGVRSRGRAGDSQDLWMDQRRARPRASSSPQGQLCAGSLQVPWWELRSPTPNTCTQTETPTQHWLPALQALGHGVMLPSPRKTQEGPSDSVGASGCDRSLKHTMVPGKPWVIVVAAGPTSSDVHRGAGGLADWTTPHLAASKRCYRIPGPREQLIL